MDCHSITLFFRTMSGNFSLFFLLMLSVPLQGAITISASPAQACGTSGETYLVTFTVSNLPELEPEDEFYATNVVKRHALFLYFGDGTHVELIAYEDETSFTCEHLYTDINATETPFEVYGQVTSVYIPSDQDTERAISKTDSKIFAYNLVAGTESTAETPPCTACETNPEEENHLPGRDFFPENLAPDEKEWVQRIRHAVPNDQFTLAIHYGFDICRINSGQNQVPFDSLITIKYDSDIFEFKWSNLNVNDDGAGNINFGFEVDKGEDISDQMMYLFFDVKEEGVAGNEYVFEINRAYEGSDACDGKATPNDKYARFADLIRASHDPNEKQAKPKFFESAGPIEMKYTIRFFNEGSTAVKQIMIKDVLDKQLDFTSIEEIKFWMEGVDPTTPSEIAGEDPNDHIFKWGIGPDLLPEDGLKPIIGKQALPQEYAYLSFIVNTKAGLAANTCIPNKAEIFFYEDDLTSASRTIVERTLSCRNVCAQKVNINEAFRLSDDTNTVIRINEAPTYLMNDGQGGFYFTNPNFTKATIVYQVCTLNTQSGLYCEPIQSRTFCRKLPITLPPVTPPFNWGIIILLLIAAILISFAARQSPNI